MHVAKPRNAPHRLQSVRRRKESSLPSDPQKASPGRSDKIPRLMGAQRGDLHVLGLKLGWAQDSYEASVVGIIFSSLSMFGPPRLTFALAMLLPGGDSGLHRAHVAVAAMAGAADRADDNIVDDQREAAGYAE